MDKTVYVVISNLNNRKQIHGVFSRKEYADKFCDVENSTLEDFRLDDERFIVKPMVLDINKIPENQCYKKYWDYAICIDKDNKDYGIMKYCGTGKELVHINKEQDVEIYKNEYIYCRSYISKKEAENIAKDQWSILEQKLYVGV